MVNDQHIVFAGDKIWHVVNLAGDHWRVHGIPVQEDSTTESLVESVKLHLDHEGYTDQPVILALDSSWCLCATISTEDLEKGNRYRAMGFRLEEHLPVSAEEIVADYLNTGKDKALGVCCELEKLEVIVNALEAGDILVQHICPSAFLFAGHVLNHHPQVDGILIGRKIDNEGDLEVSYDLIEIQKDKPTQWWWFAEDDNTLRERLAALLEFHDKPMQLAIIGTGDEIFQADSLHKKVQCIKLDEMNFFEAVAKHAAKILAGSVSAWIDLRRDKLAAPRKYKAYSKPISALVVAVVLLMVCVSGAMQWRGRQYKTLSKQYLQEQIDLYKETMPNSRVPGSIKGRLLSERKRLAGVGGQASGEINLNALKRQSAMVHLQRVLGSLPTDLRYRILDLNIQPNRIRLDGQARSHVEAERLAMALRQSGTYEVESPKTEVLKERGVSFLFNAIPRAGSELSKENH